MQSRSRRALVSSSAVLALLGCAAAALTAQANPLPRVYVFTDKDSNDGALKDREESVKDLQAAFAGRKKVLSLADSEERSDVVVEVLERATTVPKFRIGISPSPSRVPGVDPPMRAAVLRVKVTRGEHTVEFRNKNTPFENPHGWDAAADDVVKQIEKWMLAKK
jgi:hypothetical protein